MKELSIFSEEMFQEQSSEINAALTADNPAGTTCCVETPQDPCSGKQC